MMEVSTFGVNEGENSRAASFPCDSGIGTDIIPTSDPI